MIRRRPFWIRQGRRTANQGGLGATPGGNTNPYQSGPNINGGSVAVQSTGSGNKGNVFITPVRYQFIANGLWQGRLGHRHRRELRPSAGVCPPVLSRSGVDARCRAAAEAGALGVGGRRVPDGGGLEPRWTAREEVHVRTLDPRGRPGRVQSAERRRGASAAAERQAPDVQQHSGDHEPAHCQDRRAVRLRRLDGKKGPVTSAVVLARESATAFFDRTRREPQLLRDV